MEPDANWEYLREYSEPCDANGNTCNVYLVAVHSPPPNLLVFVFRGSLHFNQILQQLIETTLATLTPSFIYEGEFWAG
jgi:hypothetical protein